LLDSSFGEFEAGEGDDLAYKFAVFDMKMTVFLLQSSHDQDRILLMLVSGGGIYEDMIKVYCGTVMVQMPKDRQHEGLHEGVSILDCKRQHHIRPGP
jgi:hypothetical protein